MEKIIEYLRDHLDVFAVSRADGHHSPAIRLVTRYTSGLRSHSSERDLYR